MRLAFNIEVKEEKEYLLSEEDSKKVVDKAFELAKKDKEDSKKYFTLYIEYATQFLLESGEIEGVLFNESVNKNLTSVWVEE